MNILKYSDGELDNLPSHHHKLMIISGKYVHAIFFDDFTQSPTESSPHVRVVMKYLIFTLKKLYLSHDFTSFNA